MRAGNLAAWRAGGLEGNHLSHSSFIPAKSSSSASTMVALAILSKELLAASRMAWRSEERRVGSVSVRVDFGGRRIIKKKTTISKTEMSNISKIHNLA